MHDPLSRVVTWVRDYLLGIVVLAALLAILLIAAFPKGQYGTAAEWAGVAGTTAAVFAALWTSGQTLRIEQARNEARALVCANFLAPYIISIANRSSVVLAYCNAHRFGLDDAFAIREPYGSIVENHLNIDVAIPREAFTDASALPAECARLCIRAEAFLRQWNQLTAKSIPQMRDFNGEQGSRYLDDAALCLANVVSVSQAAKQALSKVLGEPIT